MDYKKAYEEALERAKSGKPLDEVFPELVESKDERIRKDIINYIGFEKPIADKDENRIKEMISYLKKQNEQKIARWKSLGECSDIPDGHYVVGWFRFGDYRLGIMCGGLFVDPDGNRAEQPKEVFYIPNVDEEYVYAEQKPTNSEKPKEWSEEDERMLKEIVSFFKDGTVKLQHDLNLYAGFLENKFKFLRPQPHWKPSDEQMEELLNASTPGKDFDCDILAELYEQLKKL